MMAISRWTGGEKPFLAEGTTKVDIWKLEKYELQFVMAGVTIRKAGRGQMCKDDTQHGKYCT